ncbi:unnamed protein product [Lactuca virosa]|uniref:DNA topoisomerase I eukaryotic-type domain-containing protein n=1 Tax=Lactuca virosa TaxID=75947 RepID=A0AAU9M3P9_9ASTR|nr:unnamed protein product [Lactuca virosa]
MLKFVDGGNHISSSMLISIPSEEYLALLPLFSKNSNTLGQYWLSLLKDYSYVCFSTRPNIHVIYILLSRAVPRVGRAGPQPRAACSDGVSNLMEVSTILVSVRTQLAKKLASPAMPVGEEFQPEAAIVNYFASGTNSTQVMLLLFLIIKAAIDLYREMMESGVIKLGDKQASIGSPSPSSVVSFLKEVFPSAEHFRDAEESLHPTIPSILPSETITGSSHTGKSSLEAHKQTPSRAPENTGSASCTTCPMLNPPRAVRVGNFRVEPPGLFRGGGEHPKMGKLKKRIRPSDITINIGKDAPIPECPIPGESWKEIRHDNTVTWLAYWNDPINSKEFNYVFLAASSSLKGQSDKEKYEKARKLKGYIKGIRKAYTKDFGNSDVTKRPLYGSFKGDIGHMKL